MADGPCGEQFKAAFSCFVYSEAEPKGMDCVEKFKGMQDCFREHPEIYGEGMSDFISIPLHLLSPQVHWPFLSDRVQEPEANTQKSTTRRRTKKNTRVSPMTTQYPKHPQILHQRTTKPSVLSQENSQPRVSHFFRPNTRKRANQ
jgi:hypothetical protein